VHEIGRKQAVSRSANEFTLNTPVVLAVRVINRLIPDNTVSTIKNDRVPLNRARSLSLSRSAWKAKKRERYFKRFFLPKATRLGMCDSLRKEVILLYILSFTLSGICLYDTPAGNNYIL